MPLADYTRLFGLAGIRVDGRPGRHVRFWPKADMGYCTAHVRFRG